MEITEGQLKKVILSCLEDIDLSFKDIVKAVAKKLNVAKKTVRLPINSALQTFVRHGVLVRKDDVYSYRHKKSDEKPAKCKISKLKQKKRRRKNTDEEKESPPENEEQRYTIYFSDPLGGKTPNFDPTKDAVPGAKILCLNPLTDLRDLMKNISKGNIGYEVKVPESEPQADLTKRKPNVNKTQKIKKENLSDEPSTSRINSCDKKKSGKKSRSIKQKEKVSKRSKGPVVGKSPKRKIASN